MLLDYNYFAFIDFILYFFKEVLFYILFTTIIIAYRQFIQEQYRVVLVFN